MTDGTGLSVLQVVSSPWLTGAASAVFELSCALRDLGHRVLLAATPGNLLEERARAEGLAFEGFHFNRRWGPGDFLRDRSRLGRLISRSGVRIVHAHLSHDHWTALAAGRGKAPPATALVRTFHLPRHVHADPFHRVFCYGRTDGFMAVSDAIRKRCVETAGLPPGWVRTQRGMVDTDFFRPGTGAESAGGHLGLDGAGPVVGTVSRLAPNRGHSTLLEAFGSIRERIPGARLLITGKGEHRGEIVRRSEALGFGTGAGGEVILAGFWDGDLRDVLRRMSVFVLQSGGSEGTGRALLEAMAYGLPCVVAARDGLDEIVEDGKTGSVVPPADARALAEAVIGLLRDPERAAALGAMGRKKVREDFDRPVQAGRAVAFYRELLSRAEKGKPS